MEHAGERRIQINRQQRQKDAKSEIRMNAVEELKKADEAQELLVGIGAEDQEQVQTAVDRACIPKFIQRPTKKVRLTGYLPDKEGAGAETSRKRPKKKKTF